MDNSCQLDTLNFNITIYCYKKFKLGDPSKEWKQFHLYIIAPLLVFCKINKFLKVVFVGL